MIQKYLIARSLVILTISLNVHHAFAYDGNYSSTDYGIAGNSCGKMTEEIKNNASFYEVYFDGYVSAINDTVYGDIDFFKNTDSISRYKFILKYCEDNPLKSVAEGINQMVLNITGKNSLTLSRFGSKKFVEQHLNWKP